MPVTFRIVQHTEKPGQEVVEVIKDGHVVATLYGDRPNCDLMLVSAHFAGELETGTNFPKGVQMFNGARFDQIPAVNFAFNARPYVIPVGSTSISRIKPPPSS